LAQEVALRQRLRRIVARDRPERQIEQRRRDLRVGSGWPSPAGSKTIPRKFGLFKPSEIVSALSGSLRLVDR